MTQASTRKFAGSTTPCQSNAAAMRFQRSPPAAMKVATQAISTSAAQRIRIAQRQPRRRPAGLERARRQERALDMGVPQRERIGILGRDGELVGDRRRRAMPHAAAAIEPAQRRRRRRACADSRAAPSRRRTRTANTDSADRAAERRQPQPHAEPGHREEQSDAVASRASAGHSRSQKIVSRARHSAAASAGCAAGSAGRFGAAGDRVPSRRLPCSARHCPSINRSTAAAFCASQEGDIPTVT